MRKKNLAIGYGFAFAILATAIMSDGKNSEIITVWCVAAISLSFGILYVRRSIRKGKPQGKREEFHCRICGIQINGSAELLCDVCLKTKQKRDEYFGEEKSPFENENLDPYSILGVRSDATATEIKVRYRELSKKFHPDRESSILADELMKRVNHAYELLCKN
tara:strand:+ start:458 stop:946 length:489 start_codon:yes stop_codon:yes gene_type:complete